MKQLAIGYIMTKSDKIKQLKSSLKNTKAQLKRREAKIARLEARNSQLEAEAKKEEEQRQAYGAKSEEYYKTIPGHQFSEFVVQIAIAIRCATNASPRDIVKILEILAKFTFGLVDKLPSYNTIDNWVRKCGLDEINQTPKALNDNNYAMIIDECMMIGSQKLLTLISVPAEHQGRPSAA